MMYLNCCLGTGKEKKSVLTIGSLGFVMPDEVPSEEIQKNQKEMLGFRWEEYSAFDKKRKKSAKR